MITIDERIAELEAALWKEFTFRYVIRNIYPQVEDFTGWDSLDKCTEEVLRRCNGNNNEHNKTDQ